jgi:prepilin-type N-terminal cleavage/methylation domain-containing protein
MIARRLPNEGRFAHPCGVHLARKARADTKGTSLAQRARVTTRQPRQKFARGQRGFTLLELMVVVIIVGVIVALALPSMRLATYDRHAYQDAGAIMQLFREARLRAVARGSAILVSMISDHDTDRGTFKVYEAVNPDKQGNPVPFPSCKSPMTWVLPPSTSMGFIDSVDLNGTPEAEADIETEIYSYSPPAEQAQLTAVPVYVCYTPLGRSYFTTGQTIGFSGMQPSTTVLEVRVTRGTKTPQLQGASNRSVIIEPNGMPRILTKVLPPKS